MQNSQLSDNQKEFLNRFQATLTSNEKVGSLRSEYAYKKSERLAKEYDPATPLKENLYKKNKAELPEISKRRQILDAISHVNFKPRKVKSSILSIFKKDKEQASPHEKRGEHNEVANRNKNSL